MLHTSRRALYSVQPQDSARLGYMRTLAAFILAFVAIPVQHLIALTPDDF
jgi:hypothetical protein